MAKQIVVVGGENALTGAQQHILVSNEARLFLIRALEAARRQPQALVNCDDCVKAMQALEGKRVEFKE